MRRLGIPTMKDRAMQALHLLALEPSTETAADLNSYGFRPKRSTADALQLCFNVLCRGCSPQWVLEGDIKGCFDHISHQWMLQHVLTDKVVLQKWLQAGYIENRTLFSTEAGTPQGGIISPTLANMTLDGLEKLLAKHFPRQKWKDGKIWSPKVNLVRYADDFIITGGSKELLENEVRPLVERFLQERGLALSADKTRITHIDEGFDFLGQHLRKYDGKPLVKPSKKNTHALMEKVRGIIDANQSVSQTVLIGLLNPVIRGWANYHQHCAAKETFNRVDHEIWRSLWRWARRRHPKKSRDWVKKHCFPALRNRAWTFAVRRKSKPRTANRFGCALCMRAKPKSGVMSKSGGMPTRSTHSGRTTLRNVRSTRSSASPASKPGLNRRETGSAHAGLCSGLSRMRRKSQVRF